MQTNCHSCGDEYGDDVLDMQAENAVLKTEVSKWISLHKATADLCEKLQKQLAALKAQEPVAWSAFHLDGSAHIFQQKETAQAFGDVVPLFTAQQPADIPAGWKLVPVEPTDEMILATTKGLAPEWVPLRGDQAAIKYRTMLAAAPEAPQASGQQAQRHEYL